MKIKYVLALLIFGAVFVYGAESRIINGAQANVADTKWDFIVSLRDGGFHSCGASLISSDWVLTASHCVVSNGKTTDPSNLSISYGNYNNQLGNIANISQVIVHPNYDDVEINNDIALLKLSSPINNIAPIILDRSSPLSAGMEAYVGGWGNISTSGDVYPENLQEVMVPVVDFDTCNSSYFTLTNNMFCAGYMAGGKDSCQGDSGGPLISQIGGKWTQIGIVSFGDACAAINYPGVYAKVQNYISWIEGYTGPLSNSSSSQSSSSSSTVAVDTTSLENGWHLLGATQDLSGVDKIGNVRSFWRFQNGAWIQDGSVEKGKGFWLYIDN